MQNLREAIAGYRIRLAQENKEQKRDALLAVALEYLERCVPECQSRVQSEILRVYIMSSK